VYLIGFNPTNFERGSDSRMGQYSDDELYRMHIKGEISDDQYLAGIEKNCSHKSEIEVNGDVWVEYCDKCGAELGRGAVGSGGVAATKGGCVVAALLILGTTLVGIYGIVELLTHV
jgi:hypothetical protein